MKQIETMIQESDMVLIGVGDESLSEADGIGEG